MLRAAITVLLLAAPLLAQTTWTSFEDRKGHAIASDPTGGVLMAGEYRSDTDTMMSSDRRARPRPRN